MGATKNLSLAETEYTINCTFKILGKHRNFFESKIRESVNVVDYRVVPNTEWLYENDTAFKKLVKKAKQANEEKLDYINKHNTLI